jgi:lysophospholipase L1-like esterase
MGHNRRRAALSGYAAQRSYTMYDPYSAFVDGSGAVIAGLVSGDGVHPTTTGSQAWASYMSDAFDRRR